MAGLAGTSVPYDPVAGEDTPSTASYDRAVRDALAELPYDVRAAWMARYAAQEDAASRAEALVERAGTALLAADRPSTIRDVWMLLARRAGSDDDADMRAAAALAGMAMGLQAS
jgi:hypothetical protein